MAKSQKKTVEVKKSVKVIQVESHLSDALSSLFKAADATKEVTGCPDQLTARFISLHDKTVRSVGNVKKQLGNIENKAARVEASKARKVKHLAKLIIQQEKLAAKITALKS